MVFATILLVTEEREIGYFQWFSLNFINKNQEIKKV